MSINKRKPLGKGLSALLKEGDSIQSARDENAEKIVGAIAELSIDSIVENPFQPRTKFSEEALEELSQSIVELGVIQPITVRKIDSSFQIISGERRFRASKKAGLDKIPAYIRLADDQEMLEMALVENIQREELDAIEIALSYQRLIEECQLTQEAMSERVGKKRSTITNYLRLLKLQPIVQAGLRDQMISMGHARAIINVASDMDQMDIYHKIIARDLSVRQVESLVRNLKKENSQSDVDGSGFEEVYNSIETALARKFETPVSLKKLKSGKGKIVIPFDGDKDLERILTLFKK